VEAILEAALDVVDLIAGTLTPFFVNHSSGSRLLRVHRRDDDSAGEVYGVRADVLVIRDARTPPARRRSGRRLRLLKNNVNPAIKGAIGLRCIRHKRRGVGVADRCETLGRETLLLNQEQDDTDGALGRELPVAVVARSREPVDLLERDRVLGTDADVVRLRRGQCLRSADYVRVRAKRRGTDKGRGASSSSAAGAHV